MMPLTAPSRRDFLRMSTAALATPLALTTLAGTGRAAAQAGEDIDAHVHVWTPDTEKYKLAPGYTKEGMSPASFTPEELFAHSKPAGVNRIVLIQMSYYRFDNSYMLDTIARYPDVFRGVAIVDENAPDVDKAMLGLVSGGVRGFRMIADQTQCKLWKTSAGIKKMWSVCADANLKMCLLANPDVLPIIAEMCKKYPKTPVVIDHMARIGMTGEVNSKDADNLCRLSESENVYVKTSAFYALGAKKPPYTDLGPLIRKLRDAYGAKRLMWASDCPFQVENGHSYQAAIELIRNKLDFLSKEERDAMLRGTAESVFFS